VAAGYGLAVEFDTEPWVCAAPVPLAGDVVVVCDGLALVETDLLGVADLLGLVVGLDELLSVWARGVGEPVQPPVEAAVTVSVTVTCGLGVDGVGVGVTVGVTVTLGLAVTVTVTVTLGLAVPVVLSLTGGVVWTAGGVELLD
jgi:hypothetical protein